MPTELLYISDAKSEFQKRKETIERTKEKVKKIVSSTGYAVERAIRAGETQAEVVTDIKVGHNTPFDAELLAELEAVITNQKGYKMKLSSKSVSDYNITADGGPGETFYVQYWSLLVSGWAE